MKKIMKMLGCLVLVLGIAAPAMAADTKQKVQVLIINANAFDGKNEKLAEGVSVLVEGNTIAKIAKSIPETMLDAVRNVGVKDRKIAVITKD